MSDWRDNYRAAGIPKRHQNFRTTDNESQHWAESYSKIKAVIHECGIAGVLGKRGTGKSQAAASAIGYTCQDMGRNALYTKAFDVFLSIRNGNNANSETTEKQEVEKYLKPFLLVIDAFEVRGDTDFENRVLDHIIDRRYDAQRPTILISNEEKAPFIASVGVSTIDRLREGGGLIEFTGESFRGELNYRNNVGDEF